MALLFKNEAVVAFTEKPLMSVFLSIARILQSILYFQSYEVQLCNSEVPMLCVTDA